MSSTQTDPGTLRRDLGPLSAISIVVGAIIGVGIFFTPSSVAALSADMTWALAAWALGGLIALCGALSFAELGGMYPRTGGHYEILRDSYGPAPAFLYVFCNATAIQAGAIAIIAIICAMNLGLAVGGSMPEAFATSGLAALLIVGLTVTNAMGVRWGATVQNATVLAKLLTLAAVALLAALAPAAPPATAVVEADTGLVAGLFAALVPVLFSFGGWQHALWVGGEVRDPARNVPRAIIGGVLVVIGAYLLVNWAYFSLLGFEGVANSKMIAAEAVSAVHPEIGARLVAGAVAVSAFGVLNAQLLSGPRLICGMAADGRFFSVFGRVDARFRTPLPAIGLLGGLGLALLLLAGADGVDELLNGVVLVDAAFFVLTGLALVVLRFKRPDAERSVRVPMIVAGIFVLGEIAVMVGAFAQPKYRTAAYIGVAWVVVAAVFYALFFRRASTPPE
ncbi:MAG: amino acid permease [Myxococcota bacterium]|jgi:APA family basic amino acid/polyamine antiporter|nr:amino acid permease [Myxococcota bacterium]